MIRGFYTVEEVCRFTGIKQGTVMRAINKCQLIPNPNAGTGVHNAPCLLFSEQDIKDWMVQVNPDWQWPF